MQLFFDKYEKISWDCIESSIDGQQSQLIVDMVTQSTNNGVIRAIYNIYMLNIIHNSTSFNDFKLM